jgi:hypothetical protein
MQDFKNNFEKLPIEEQRKFIINYVLKDKYFNKIINSVKDNYCEYILEGEELGKYKLELNNRRNALHIKNALKEYQHAVDKIMAEYSRYKDIVYDVFSCKESIENLCKSKYINGTDENFYRKNYVFFDIIRCYYNTRNTISNYGGETENEEDDDYNYGNQSLLKAVKILLKNPYICDDIKNDKKYKQYYEEFFNDKQNHILDYNENEEDVESAEEIELSDIEDEDYDNDEDDDDNEDSENID